MAKIKLNYYDYSSGYTFTCGFEFLNKEGKSLLKAGLCNGYITKVFEVNEDEQVIGIKAHTVRDPKEAYHGSLLNLRFKIGKTI